jgi:transcriptional regulator of acetoin/glycerol metabolism
MILSILQHFIDLEWRGNVRELQNIIEILIVTTPDTYITIDDLPEHLLITHFPARPRGGGQGFNLIEQAINLRLDDKLKRNIMNFIY